MANKANATPIPWNQPLFNHMSAEHGMTLLESEMDEIIRVVREMDYRRPPVPELEGALPVVLYFPTDKDRQEFVELVKLAKPNMELRSL
jgi:hypothetical protein